MAVECVDVDVDIFENPGLAKCAKRLGISEEEMVGHLVRLWIWEIKLDNREASEHPQDISIKDLAEAANYSGDANRFFKALWEGGFF